MKQNLRNSLIYAFKRKFPSAKTFRLNKRIYVDFRIDLDVANSVDMRVTIPDSFINTPPRVKVINLEKNDWIRTLVDWHVYDGTESHDRGELCYVLPIEWREKFKECLTTEGSTIYGMADFAVNIIEYYCHHLLSIHWNNRYNSSNKWPEGVSEWPHGEEGIRQWKKEHEKK